MSRSHQPILWFLLTCVCSTKVSALAPPPGYPLSTTTAAWARLPLPLLFLCFPPQCTPVQVVKQEGTLHGG